MDFDSNPYLDRVVARMRADNAVGKLQAHWSARSQRHLYRVGYWIEHAGFLRLSARYESWMGPLHNWLAERQRVFLRRYL